MIILFSPSEEKKFIYKSPENIKFHFLESLLFGADIRIDFINNYLNFLKYPKSNYQYVIGIKEDKVFNASINLDKANTIEAINLYNGVAFKALDINSLSKDGIEFIYKNVLIFSNLFGPIRASDKIPYYKLKQGQTFNSNTIYTLYSKFISVLDNYISGDVLDLRAEFYIKVYKLKIPHIKVEFYKNGKKSTHYSKYYKGLLLRNIALSMNYVEPFKILDIKQDNLARIISYDVSDFIA